MEKVYLLFELLDPENRRGEKDLLGVFPSLSAAREGIRDIEGGRYSQVSEPIRMLGSLPRWKVVGGVPGDGFIVRISYMVQEVAVGDFVDC